MNSPYESVYAGTFLYTVGFLAGREEPPLQAPCFSLLAQNPGDQKFGDVLASWEGRKFITEFKREEGTVRAEFKKEHRKELLRVFASPDGASKLALSAKCHFLAFGSTTAGTAELMFMRYCDISDTARQERGGRIDLNKFIAAMRKGVGLESRAFKSYLGVLKECYDSTRAEDTAEASSGGGLSVSSLVVNYDDKKKQVSFAIVDFSRDLEKVLDLDYELLQQTRQHTLGRDRGDEDYPSRGRGRGQGRGGGGMEL